MVRMPVYAGSFYAADAAELRNNVRFYLASAERAMLHMPPRALVVPHAGYQYSGPVAGSAYASLLAYAQRIEKVVLLGPSHRVAFAGLALPVEDSFASPLGEVAIDAGLRDLAMRDEAVNLLAAAHAEEHSLEVQLPFLQVVLPGVPVLPLVAGACAPETVARVLARLVQNAGTLVVVSSDLSHYLSYAKAREVDGETARRLLALEDDLGPERACGSYALCGLVRFAREQFWRAHQLDLRNSGDTAGGKSQVVGYGAFVFNEAMEDMP